MKRLLAGFLGAVILLGVPVSMRAAPARNRTRHSARTQKARPDSYPKMRAAIAALEAAKAELEKTAANFGGHKSEALDAVNNALKRLRLALQFEKY